MNEERLRKGAHVLGALWRSGQKCRDGWKPMCSCEAPTQFCVAKKQWIAVAIQGGRAVDPDLLLAESMTAFELDEAGVTIELDNGVKIGPGGIMPVKEAARLTETPEAVPAVLQVLKHFPGARVVKGT